MIFEMRTYRLQPGSVPEVEKRFGEALTERVKVSPLGAFFHTEVGPLNHIIHIWPYDDLQHRTRVHSQSIANCRPRPRNSSSRWKARSSMRRRSARLSRRGSTAIYTKSAPTRCSPRRRSAGRPALGRADRGAGKAFAIGRRRPYRTRPAEPMDPHLGLQGRQRASAHPRGVAQGRYLAAGDSRHVHQAGEHARRPGVVLTAGVAAKPLTGAE
jgi:hypothetical protein